MDKLQVIFLETFNLTSDELNDDISMDNTTSWDSLTHIILISRIEDEIGIDFTMDEIGQIKSYGILKKVIEAKLSR